MALNFQIIQGLKHINENFRGLQLTHPTVPRRCSVSIIVRFPGLKVPSGVTSLSDLLELAMENPSSDSAEILFIKRTSRKGDRWSGHVALPGGKRDPEDADDLSTAQRETLEEVGLDLTQNSILVGPLDQRFVKTSWGRVTLMTLCPFVFVLTGNPKLSLQPAEIDRAFWIPIAQLFSSQSGTSGYESVPLGDRLRLHDKPLIPRFLHPFIKSWVIGSMKFGAIDLLNPIDMTVSDPEPGNYDAVPSPPLESQLPYKLWGLTLGIITDLLEVIRPKTEILCLKYPTMEAPDLRLMLAIVSYNFRRNKRKDFKSRVIPYREGTMDLTGYALDGYFEYLANAIFFGLTARAVVLLVILVKLVKRYTKK